MSLIQASQEESEQENDSDQNSWTSRRNCPPALPPKPNRFSPQSEKNSDLPISRQSDSYNEKVEGEILQSERERFLSPPTCPPPLPPRLYDDPYLTALEWTNVQAGSVREKISVFESQNESHADRTFRATVRTSCVSRVSKNYIPDVIYNESLADGRSNTSLHPCFLETSSDGSAPTPPPRVTKRRTSKKVFLKDCGKSGSSASRISSNISKSSTSHEMVSTDDEGQGLPILPSGASSTTYYGPPASISPPEDLRRNNRSLECNAGIANFGNLHLNISVESDRQKAIQCRRKNYENQPSKKSREEENFIKAVNRKTQEQNITTAQVNFKPNCKIVVLNKNGKEVLEDATYTQKQVYKTVSLDTIHETINNHTESHAMVIGGPGDGKTIAAKRYAHRVLSGKVPALTAVEMVHFVEEGALHQKKDATAFDLLFSQQLGDCVDDVELHAGENWIKKNPERVLLVLDGLDRIEVDKHGCAKIHRTTKASAFTIIRNVFRGSFFNGMWILSSSRWQWIWSQPLSELPTRTIELCGYSKETVMPLLSCIIPPQMERIMKNVLARYPRIAELCKIPMFLEYFAKTLSPSDCDPHTISQQSVLVNVLHFLKGSQRGMPMGETAVRSVIALAYESLKEGKKTFSHAEVVQLPEVEHGEMENFVDAKPEMGEIHREIFGDFDKRYSFRNDALRVILAAIYIICQEGRAFKHMVVDGMEGSSTENVQNLVYGIVMNETLSQQVISFVERPIDIEAKRKILTDLLKNRLTSSSVCDLQTSLLLYECMDCFGLCKPRLRIELKDVDQPCDGHAVLAIAKKYHQFKGLKARKLCINSSSLSLLGEHRALQVQHLVITGEVLSDELDKLWNLLQDSPGIETVILVHYSITYHAQMKNVNIITLRGGDVDLLRRFLHEAPESTEVSIKQFRTTDRTGKDSSELEELESLLGIYKFEIDVVDVGMITARTESMIADMLLGKSGWKMKRVQLGLIQVSRKYDFTYQANTLVISGPLTDSDGILRLMKMSIWEMISTRDFDIHIRPQVLHVYKKRPAPRKSFLTLCKVFEALGHRQLNYEGIKLFLEFNEDTSRKETKIIVKEKRNCQECLAGYCNFLWLSETTRAYIRISRSKTDCRFLAVIRKDGTYAMKIDHLHRGLSILNYLLSVVEISCISIKKCWINSTEEISRLRNISSKTLLEVEHLNVAGEVMDLANSVFTSSKSMSVNYATIGTPGKCAKVSFSKNRITIPRIDEDNLIELFDSILDEVHRGTVVVIDEFVAVNVFSQHDVQRERKLNKMIQEVVSSGVIIKVKRLECQSFFKRSSDLMNLFETVHAEEISTPDAEMNISYDENAKISQVMIVKAKLQDYMKIPVEVRRSRGVKVQTCILDLHQRDIVTRLLSRTRAFLATIQDKTIIEFLLMTACERDIMLELRDAIERGVIQQMKSIQTEFHNIYKYDRENQILVVLISEVDSLKVEKFISDHDEFCGKFIAENCIIQNHSGNSAEEQVSNFIDLPEEVIERMLVVAKAVSQENIQNGIAALKNLTSRYGDSLVITKLTVQGVIHDVNDLFALSVEMSIPTIASKNATIFQETKTLVLHREIARTLKQVDCIGRSDWRCHVPRISLEDISSLDWEIVQETDITFEVIETSRNLKSATSDLVDIMRRVKPTRIITADYQIRLRISENGTMGISGTPRSDSDVYLDLDDDLGRFTVRVGGLLERYSSDHDSYEEMSSLSPGTISDERIPEWNTSDEEDVYDDSEYYLNNQILATKGSSGESFYESDWQENGRAKEIEPVEDDTTHIYEYCGSATSPKVIYGEDYFGVSSMGHLTAEWDETMAKELGGGESDAWFYSTL